MVGPTSIWGEVSDQDRGRIFPAWAPVLFFIPIIVFVAALFSGTLFLDYVHVITGGMWTGIDLFMGLFGRGVMSKITPPARVEVARKLTPIMMFLMPSIAGWRRPLATTWR